MRRRVLFLGYNGQQTGLIDAISIAGWDVIQESRQVEDLSEYDSVVSFGYRHILPVSVLATAPRPVINLHISFLPWNRGAHPNFWSFYDGTPSGVSIHYIDEGIDTGPILLQEQYKYASQAMTFRQTHADLVARIEALFVANLEALLMHTIPAIAQTGSGSVHKLRDLPKEFVGWDSHIDAEIERLRQ